MSARSRRRRYEQRKSYQVIERAFWAASDRIKDRPTVAQIAAEIPVPKGKNPAEVTVAEAIDLLAARIEKMGSSPGKRRKAPARKATGAAKPAAKGRNCLLYTSPSPRDS